jgi:hypothetical protein
MRIPPTGYLTHALPCGEPACVISRAFNGVFSVLIAGLAAGVESSLAAMRWRD